MAKVSDDGPVRLEGLTRLEILNLKSTNLTDAGLVHLKGLRNLQELTSGTRITDQVSGEPERVDPSYGAWTANAYEGY